MAPKKDWPPHGITVGGVDPLPDPIYGNFGFVPNSMRDTPELYMATPNILTETEWDESEHPRDDKGKFVEKGGQDQERPDHLEIPQQIEQPLSVRDAEQFKHRRISDRLSLLRDLGYLEKEGFEQIEVVGAPSPRHMATAYAVLQDYPDMDETFMVQQAHKADQLRQQHDQIMRPTLKFIENAFPQYQVSGRVKGRFQMLEKLGRKRFYKDVSQLKDVSGIRIVGKNIEDVEGIKEWVRHNFDLVEEEDWISQPIDGYRGFHFSIKNMDGSVSEIQVKTKNMQRWSDYMHDTLYKPARELENFVRENELLIKLYGADVSEYYYHKDLGEDWPLPNCPPKLQYRVGCLT